MARQVAVEVKSPRNYFFILEDAVKALGLPKKYVEEASNLIEIARGPRCGYLCYARTSRILATLFLWLVVRKHHDVLPGGLYSIAKACGASYAYATNTWIALKDALEKCPDFVWVKGLKPSKRAQKW